VLVSNGRGDRLVVWRSDAGFKFSFARRGGHFGKPRRIASPWMPSESMQAALDEDGRAVIAWTAWDGERRGEGHGDFGCCERLLTAIARPGGPAPRARRMTPAGVDADAPRLSVLPSGRAALGWSEYSTVRVRFGSTRRGFRREERVADGILLGVVLGSRLPRVALGVGYPIHVVEYVRRRAGVYRRGRAVPADGVRLASDARGNEVLVRNEVHSDFSGFLEVATRPPGGDLKRRVLATDPDGGGFFDPLFDVAPTGAAAVVWSPPSSDTVTAVVRAPGGDFSSPRVVYRAPAPPDGLPPLSLQDVAAGPHGGAAIAVIPDARPARGRIVLLGRHGRVRAQHDVGREPVRELHVVRDGAGTAAAWTTSHGLFVTRTR
jgi:hypothetical protein